MGAGAACEGVYRDGFKWFGAFIDKDTYLTNFQIMDSDADGNISCQDVQKWVNDNASKYPDECWDIIKSSSLSIMMAHKAAATPATKVVPIQSFRALLIHLYTISILYRHFSGLADKSHIQARKKINLEEYIMACETLCFAHEVPPIPIETLENDFNELDNHFTGQIGFIQICPAIFKYFDSAAENGNNDPPPASKGLKAMLSGMKPEEKTRVAMEQLKAKLNREDASIVKFQTDFYPKLKAKLEAKKNPDNAAPTIESPLNTLNSYVA
eukprot:TRINITY_DN64000_c0_g1_i1.p1 TRINITY_DN64000_c0_g1~~TRINITY_DN64000_c0_g1_i1.p1  ORF type:complete len:269 (-),score=-2.84 TRINITY_DN64000_c0_g1_i1:269-1075(-)